jgi:UDPglucose 6-dehydrogenase
MSGHIAVLGLGYVGLVVSTCLAREGRVVIGVEANPARLEPLMHGRLPFYEPGLERLFALRRATGSLLLTREVTQASCASIVFVTVGTPSGKDGVADLSQVETAVRTVAGVMAPETVLAIKSTVPVGTGERMASIVREVRGGDFRFAVVSNPEFLQQGRAVESFLNPDRIILGGDDVDAVERVASLYQDLPSAIVRTDHKTAEMIKYAANAFLATKVSYANEMAKLCDALGVDFLSVAQAVGMDRRIGTDFLAPGPGFGGSCFPKDVAALVALGQDHGVEMILQKEVLRVNHRQPRYVYNKVRAAIGDVRGRKITLLGLSFKANTDDVRESPALDVARILLSYGAVVHAYDPVAEAGSAALVPAAHYHPDPYQAATGADAVVICTEWDEFRYLDLQRLVGLLAQPVLIDARNVLDPEEAIRHGLRYDSVGRGHGGVA